MLTCSLLLAFQLPLVHSSVDAGEASRLIRSEGDLFHSSQGTHGYRATFDRRGMTVCGNAEGLSFGLELERWGRPGHETALADRAQASAVGDRLTYHWSDRLDEWFVNGTRGLEHGFTVHAPPAGTGCNLTFDLTVRGELEPTVYDDGRSVRFANRESSMTYAGLTVFDSTGSVLVASFDRTANGLRLSIDDTDATYPITIDPVVQQSYIKASNTGSDDQFGFAVAIHGDRLIVGAPNEFSASTTVDGNQLDDSLPYSGAAYVFARSGSTWVQEAYLKAPNAGQGDHFGVSVAIWGDTAVVGTNYEAGAGTGPSADPTDNTAYGAGAAYVYVFNGQSWAFQAYIKPDAIDAADSFAMSMDLYEDTLVVGANSEDSGSTTNPLDNNTTDAGAAWVFVRTGVTWATQAYLKASNPDANDAFGMSVSIHEDQIAVGAGWEDSAATGIDGNQSDNSENGAGAVYLFERQGSTWSQVHYVKASNAGARDGFGVRVEIEGDTLAVAAPSEQGTSAGIDGDQFADGALGDQLGAVYVFERQGSWAQTAYIKASNPDIWDAFGFSLDLSGNLLVVGSASESSAASGIDGDQLSNSVSNSGAAYMFVRDGSSWTQRSYLKASNPGGLDNFGWTLALDGTSLVVGAMREDGSAVGVDGIQDDSSIDAGAAYVFDLRLNALAVSRTAGTNFNNLTAGPAVLGGTWTATVDHAVTPYTSSLLLGFRNQVSIPLASGYFVLAFGSVELFGFAPAAGTSATYQAAVPSELAFLGYQLSAQAVHFGGAPGFGLSNAIDLTLGY